MTASPEVTEKIAKRTKEIVSLLTFVQCDLYLAADLFKLAGAGETLDPDINCAFISICKTIQAINELNEIHGIAPQPRPARPH
jgi:hypothetical protein